MNRVKTESDHPARVYPFWTLGSLETGFFPHVIGGFVPG